MTETLDFSQVIPGNKSKNSSSSMASTNAKVYPDPISSHVLDQTAGVPASNVVISMSKKNEDGSWELISSK